MNDLCTYTVQLRGVVSAAEINALCPVQMAHKDSLQVERVGPATTLLTLCADQSGLIGLMRHLHGLGFIFLSVTRTEIEGCQSQTGIGVTDER
jgi:hypothetical protein